MQKYGQFIVTYNAYCSLPNQPIAFVNVFNKALSYSTNAASSPGSNSNARVPTQAVDGSISFPEPAILGKETKALG